MMRPPGFMVWNPDGRMPTCVHASFEVALREAERLMRLNPADRFYVMTPVLGAPEATYARGLSDGKKEGLAQACCEIMRAEARTDRILDERDDLKARLSTAKPIIDGARRFQSLVADCLCWFNGFEAGSRGNEFARPWTPSSDGLRDLNRHLQDVERVVSGGHLFADEEIPF